MRQNPLLIAIITALITWCGSYILVRWQVSQTRDDAALNDRIDNHVDAKLQRITEDIAKLREDVAYLKARVEGATTKKIIEFSKMPEREILARLPEISGTINAAYANKVIAPTEAVVELRKKLAQVKARNPDFWVAVSSVVNYQSLVAEKMNLFQNAEEVRKTACKFISVQPGAEISGIVENLTLIGCGQQLDIGVEWKNVKFENAIIIYSGGPLRLENVTFKNCLFLTEFPKQPAPQTQKFGQALLASTGSLPNFTISTG